MAKVYATDNRYDSDVIKVFLTDDKYDADVVVYQIDNKYDAKWNKGNQYIGHFG